MRFLDALRPPAPNRVLSLQRAWPQHPIVLQIASGRDAGTALAALPDFAPTDPAPITVVVPELGGGGCQGTSPFVAHAVVGRLGDRRTVLAIPRSSKDTSERWQRLARRCGVELRTLGALGWLRLEIDDTDFRLTSIDIPLEVSQPAGLVALVRAERAREPFAFWSDVVHPHTALRANAGTLRDRLVVELAAARPACWLLDLTPGGGVSGADTTAILAVTGDVLAAELAVLAAQQMTWLRGFEERGPWEHPRIQAACELALGVEGGYDLVLRVAPGDDPAARLAERLARRLDCQVEASEGS